MNITVIDRNIVKFALYGFLKNLKFFEPFFYLYLLSIGLNYFQIGMILSVREISTYLFEIPTGVIADVWGRKRSILLCFVLYSVSFTVYYTAHTFWALIPASMIFGLGEAFRLGTHKAIVFDYLDDKAMKHLRTRVYGFTRAVAQLGLALSAIGAGAIVIWTSNYRAGFIFSIIPYFLAFGLVLTYPRSTHETSVIHRGQLWRRLKKHTIDSLTQLRRAKDLRLLLINSTLYDGAFKAGKDYIQPMIQAFVLGTVAAANQGASTTGNDNADTLLISAFYVVIYLLSAVSAQKAYVFKNLFSGPARPLNILFLLNAAAYCAIAIFADRSLPLLLACFISLFLLMNVRRPILLDYLTEYIDPAQRATMLSIESQLQSLAIILLAPAMGLVADRFSIGVMFLVLSGILALLYAFFLRFR